MCNNKRAKLSGAHTKADALRSSKELTAPMADDSTGGNEFFVGAHVSAAGGLWNAFENCGKIEGNALALFLKNQRKWESPPLKAEDAKKFLAVMEDRRFNKSMILPHGSYLINLGNPDEEKRRRSYDAFVEDLKRCSMLGIPLYNLHPGSTVGDCTVEKSVGHIADCINRAHSEVRDVCVVLETMAGQGNAIGSRFEDLKMIIELVNDKDRVGVCIDTCHIFAAGYDIRTEETYEETMKEFERVVGFHFVRGVHLNDSKADLGSGKDRHENIGKGKIGLAAFKLLMNDPRFQNMPIVLETPVMDDLGEHGTYKEEIRLLRSFIGRT